MGDMITAHYTLEYMALCNCHYVLAISITSIKTRCFFTDQQCNTYSLNKTDQLPNEQSKESHYQYMED